MVEENEVYKKEEVPEKEPSLEVKPSEPSEKKELLVRQEIKTMEKDLSKLREVEAQEEKKRISSLGPETSPTTTTTVPAEEPEEKGMLIPVEIKKTSSFFKIAIRAIIVLPLFLIAGLACWFFFLRSETKEEPILTPPLEETEEIPPEEIIETKTPPVLPAIQERLVTWGYYIPKKTRNIDTIIIHSAYNVLGGDAYSLEKVLEEFRAYRAVPHYLIDREGKVYQLAPEEAVAYHAGRGIMPNGSRKDIINLFSLGIGMIYQEKDSPAEAQYESLAGLVYFLREKYAIPIENILGFKEISSAQTNPWNFDKEYLISLLGL